VLRAENEIEILDTKLKEAEYQIRNAQLYLKFLLNRENQTPLNFEKPSRETDLLQDFPTYQVAPSYPQIKKWDMALSVQNLLDKRNQQFFMPQISLFSDIGSQEFRWQFNRKSFYLIGGVQITMPLWVNRINQIKGEQIQLDKKAIQWNKELTEQQEQLALDMVQNKVTVSKKAFTSMAKQVNTAAVYLRLTEKGFREGTVSLLELYDAQNQYTNALLQENMKYYQYLMALSELQKWI
jgi:outer membrane protein TolC